MKSSGISRISIFRNTLFASAESTPSWHSPSSLAVAVTPACLSAMSSSESSAKSGVVESERRRRSKGVLLPEADLDLSGDDARAGEDAEATVPSLDLCTPEVLGMVVWLSLS